MWKTWGNLAPDFSPGQMQTRGVSDPCEEGSSQTQVLTRLNFQSTDGTEYEFVDQGSNGTPHWTPCQNDSTPRYNRGKVFVTKDGSFMTFISDTDVKDYFPASGHYPYGYLMFNNGTRYRIENGQVEWIEDRNGNKITFTREYSCPDPIISCLPNKLTVTDSLNRQIVTTYNFQDVPNTVYDKIEYKGGDGQNRVIKIFRKGVSEVLAPGETFKQLYELFPGTWGGLVNGYENCGVTSKIELPDGKSYQFLYNSYCEVARITLPTGAAYEYEYGPGTANSTTGGLVDLGWGGAPTTTGYVIQGVQRRVWERREYVNGETGNNFSLRTTYNGGQDQCGSELSSIGVANSKANGTGSGTLISYESHWFYGQPCNTLNQEPTDYGRWKEGREWKTVLFDLDGITQLRTAETVWEQQPPSTGVESERPNNPRIKEIITTLKDSNQVSKQTFSYDQFNNRTDAYEYDYGIGQPGAFLRRSHTDFVTDTNYTDYTGAHLRGLPSQSWISSDINGVNKASLSQIEYDNYNTDANHAALVTRGNVSGFDAVNYGISNTRRGNVTAVTSYANAQNQTEAVTAYSQYDILGNVVKTIDAKGNASTIDYTDRFGTADGEARSNTLPTQLNGQSTFAFATSATNPIGYTAYTQFDYFTGAAVNTENINGVISKTVYNDLLDRPTQTVSSVGTALEMQSNMVYDDANRRVETKSDLNALNDNLIKSESFYDGLGRTVESRRYESDGNFIATKSIPFVMVQDPETFVWRAAAKASNPYRSNEPIVWMTSLSDSLGRVIKIITPDGAIVKTEYSGNAVTVTDQAGKKRRSMTNALGQLKEVHEPNDQGQLDVNGVPAQSTVYSYDTLNNLTTVNQGTPQQNRTFAYDSLSRLKTAFNPESGTINYTYDNNSSLLTKVDARQVTTSYGYDNLNRAISRTYAGEASGQQTPPVTYTYDNLTNAKGRLTKVTNGFSTTEYTEFDILGRVKKSKQTTDSVIYPEMEYVYNLSGSLIEQKYPSGRVVKNVLDNDGDLSIVQSKKNQAAGFFNYAKNFTYTSAGAVSSMQLGNGKWESTQFNSRLQPTQIALGTVQNGTDKLKLNFDYGAAQNNGNVLSQQITVPTVGANQGFTAIQTYSYDSLNRLKSATENIDGNPTPAWKQTFLYDRYGNRNFDTNNTTTLSSCPANQCNPTVDVSNNGFTSGQGYTYDLAGNVISDAQGRVFTYDGENKQTLVKDVNNVTVGEYYYDGDGKRVKKYIFSTQETTLFVYDASGKMVAEYSTTVAPASEAKVSYLTNDHLGSPRITTDANGNVISRRDFMPFGEEVFTAQRTQGLGYAADDIRQKFTAYERDIESELDFAQARYYKSAHGRFTSPDPLLESAKTNNPQSWNRYSYTFNNPTNLVDPTGLVVDDYFINRDGSYVVVENDCKCDTYYIETEKGSGEYRGLATLQENDLGLVNFPASSDFFDRYAPTEDRGGGDYGPGDHYIKPEVAAGLFGLATVLKDDYGITMSFGDMSSSNGRDPWEPGQEHHGGHGGKNGRSGLDADFRYINKDGESFQGRKARSSAQFSVEKNQTVYDTAKTFGFTENYQGNVQGRNTGLNGVTVDNNGGHNDHGHLGFDAGSARVTYAQGISVSRGVTKPLFFKK
ncbi:MAG: RHS repeat domain-containing protein [Pyrinomonadaceae bacterium]